MTVRFLAGGVSGFLENLAKCIALLSEVGEQRPRHGVNHPGGTIVPSHPIHIDPDIEEGSAVRYGGLWNRRPCPVYGKPN